MQSFAVHDAEIRLLTLLRTMPDPERQIAYGIIHELAKAPGPQATLPPNVLPIRRASAA